MDRNEKEQRALVTIRILPRDVNTEHNFLSGFTTKSTAIHHPVERGFDSCHSPHAERRDKRSGV